MASGKEKSLETVCMNNLESEKFVTANVFRTAYKVAKKSSFSWLWARNWSTRMDLTWVQFHFRFACMRIINHIATEMKATLTKRITEILARFPSSWLRAL